MSNGEKILELLQQMQSDIAGMKQDIVSMKQDITSMKQDIETIKDDIEEIKEEAEITRSGVNTLIGWAEKVEKASDFPMPEVLAI